MEASFFTAKPQHLSLTSPTPLLSSFLSRSFLRREFIGCGRNLRHPRGLISRRKCKKLRFHVNNSPELFFSASLDSHSVVTVVSVVTVSALTVVYLNYSKRHDKKLPEVSHQIRSQRNLANVDQSMGPLDLQGRTFANESKDLVKETKEISHESEDNVAELQSKKTDLMHEESLITNALDSPGSDIVTHSTGDFVTSGEPEEVTGISALPSVSSESGVGALPFILTTEMCEREETELRSELPMLMVKTGLSATIPVNGLLARVNEFEKPNQEPVEKSESSSYIHIHGESVRRELYTFYEADKSAKQSMGNLNGLHTMSSHGSLRKSNRFPTLMRTSATEGAKVSAQNFFHTAEGKTSLGVYKEGSFRKRKDLGKGRGLPIDKEKEILQQNGYTTLFTSPHPKGEHINNRHLTSQKSSTYHHFLRNGRLTDCLEILEDMERKGLLDMDNVYHSGFFHACKSQRAVKEAFYFTKFIPNPTLSTFNMLMSVCACSHDSEGAFQVLQLVQEAGLKADCKLYTTLISTCAKSGKVDTMFKVFHEMVNAEVEPNVHTYGALIDGCAKAGQVAKAFGAYGIMRSKNVEPDRVVFNALITACGQSGAVDRAFDVLSEMMSETQPIDPDHVTIGALMKACANARQIDRAREVYNMINKYNIKGTPEVYTIAVNCCSQTGDWEFACSVYNDMRSKGVFPDEMFISALIDFAGHAGKLDTAFQILQEGRTQGIHVGIMSYSSLMGACSNAKNWQKAMGLYEDVKTMNLKPTVSMMNALITALCDADQLQKAVEVLIEMKRVGLCPNTITYSILLVASEKKDDLDVGLMLLSQAKNDGVAPNLIMCRCLIAMCLRRFVTACTLGEPVLSINSEQLQIQSKWTSLALKFYRETIRAGVAPTVEEFSLVLGCLRLPHDLSLRNRLIENLGVSTLQSKGSNLCSLVDGFGAYDPRAFSLLEEAASLGIIPCVSFKQSPIVVDVRNLHIHTAEVYLLTVLKGLKHRLAAGAKLPNVTILLPIEKTRIQFTIREKTINIAGRVSQAVTALFRRLGLPYLGNESHGKIRINGVTLKRWFKPKLASRFIGTSTDFNSSLSPLGKGIVHQQRNIRTRNLSME